MGSLWYGGSIYTMKSDKDRVESVYTENGLVFDCGAIEDLRNRYKDKIDQEYNLEGNTMFPGFVDSHLHIIGHGEKLIHLDLSELTSSEQVLTTLSYRSQELEAGEWLIAEGFNENQWEDPRIIHKSELDYICPHNPILLSRVCRHAVLANTEAMRMADITEDTSDPQGGRIVRDENGEITGYFLDNAQDLIKKSVPNVSEDNLTKLVKTSIDDLYKYGLVGGHSEDLNYYGGFKKTLQAFKRGIDGEKRKFRAHLLVHHEVVDDMENEGIYYGTYTDFISMGAVKIFSDGALGGRTAWLSQQYEDDPDNYGLPIHSAEELEGLVKKARAKEMPVAVHAIGDQATWTVAKILQKYPLANGRRDRIIHAQIINDELLQLLKEIDVVLDIQPSFVASDFPWVIERIGERRLNDAYSWKTLLKHGIQCAGGSDAPIENVNPLLGIEAAVMRKSSIDNQTYTEKEQLSVYEAISLYTKGSAYVIGHETDRGQIAPGFTADFTIVNKDLFNIPAEEIATAEVKMTVVDGQVVYSN